MKSAMNGKTEPRDLTDAWPLEPVFSGVKRRMGATTDRERREVKVRRSREKECDLLVLAYIVLLHKRGKKKKETGRTAIFDVGSLFIC